MPRTKQPARSRRGLRKDPESGIWQVDITVDGGRVQRSSGTTDEQAAREWRSKLESDLWRESRLGERPKVLWATAMLEWIEDAKRRNLRSLPDFADKFEYLRTRLHGLVVADIDQEVIDGALKPLRSERTVLLGNGTMRTLAPAANATINRYSAAISSVLNYAAGKGWRDPIKVAMLPEDNEVVRWLPKDRAPKLLIELPPHLNRMARWALATGMRKANVCGFKKENVDRARRVAWVWARDAKGKKNIQIPLNDDAMAVLAEVWDEHPAYLFTWQPPAKKGKPAPPRRPITEPAGAAWQKAKARAGVEAAFRWHDLRHTWATWHVMAGTPLHVLQKLGGWASLDMVMRYAHIADDFAAQYAGGSSLAVEVAYSDTPVALAA